MKDKFARWAIISEKTEGHDLRIEEGRKSMEEDFRGEALRVLKTSSGVTGGREYTMEPTSGESGKTKDGGSLQLIHISSVLLQAHAHRPVTTFEPSQQKSLLTLLTFSVFKSCQAGERIDSLPSRIQTRALCIALQDLYITLEHRPTTCI